MKALPNPFEGMRPSDLRYGHAHVLGEYIAQTQQLVAAIQRSQSDAQRLVEESARSSKEAKAYVTDTIRPLQLAVSALLPMLSVIPEMLANKVDHLLRDPETELRRLTEQLVQAAVTLEAESRRAVAAEAGASKARAALERARVAALAPYRGARWWERVLFVFVPPALTPRTAATPAKQQCTRVSR